MIRIGDLFDLGPILCRYDKNTPPIIQELVRVFLHEGGVLY